MRIPLTLSLASLAIQSVLACINPGDPRYAEVLAQRHLSDFLDSLDASLDQQNSDNTLSGETTFDLSSPQVPGIQDIDTSHFSIDSSFDNLATEIETNPNFWQDRRETLQASANAKNPKFEVSNEYASALIFTGDYKEALKILKKQERLYPNHYETATNLGTAYELSGNLKNAKKWIAEGRKRNPKSHKGTEWLHSMILDAKLAVAKHPDWLEVNNVSVLETNWSDKAQRDRVRNGILVQLSERLVFVSAPNPIVASLFYELGTIYEYEGDIQHAEVFYSKSLEFAPIREQRIASQRNLREFKTSYDRLLTTARSEVLREAIRIASEKSAEDCCREVRELGLSLLDSESKNELNVESLTYENPTFWKALMQMNPGNQLVDSILVSLFTQNGELDKARRITSGLAPFTYAQNTQNGFGQQSMLLLTTELDSFYDNQTKRIQKGIQLHDSGKNEAAIRVYKTVTDVFPKSVWANWEIAYSSETFLRGAIKNKGREITRKIQSLDPLFMIGGTYSGGKEITQMLLRMELRELGSKNLSMEEHYYKYAENALLLEQYGLAAILYWKAAPILEHPSLSPKDLLGRYLFCMKKLGHEEVIEIFDPSLSENIENTQKFVESKFTQVASNE